MKLKLQSSQPTLSYRVGAALRHYKALLHDGLLARQSTRNLDSALATLRHCQPIYELLSPEKAVKYSISSRNAVRKIGDVN